MNTDLLFKEETENILGAFYKVYRTLGYGFLEKVYQNALCLELTKRGFVCKQQQPVNVYYEKEIVGQYIADLLVDNKIILELKAVSFLSEDHEKQLINYLKATNIELRLLLNFGERAQLKRKIFTNDKK